MHEEASDLILNRIRIFYARPGRFTQRDPIGYTIVGTNLYEYLISSPLASVDPLGLYEIEWESDFSKEQKKKIENGFKSTTNRIDEVIKQLNEYENGLNGRCPDSVRDDIGKIRDRLNNVKKLINGNENLELYKGKMPEGIDAETDWTWYSDYWTKFDETSLNAADEKEMMRVLFHESNHVQENKDGLSDQDGTSSILDPHQLDDLMKTDVDKWTWRPRCKNSSAED